MEDIDMAKTIPIRVDESLAQTLERVRREVADEFKRKYNLEKITINGTLTSQIAAGIMNGRKSFTFKIRKTGRNKGILDLI